MRFVQDIKITGTYSTPTPAFQPQKSKYKKISIDFIFLDHSLNYSRTESGQFVISLLDIKWYVLKRLSFFVPQFDATGVLLC